MLFMYAMECSILIKGYFTFMVIPSVMVNYKKGAIRRSYGVLSFYWHSRQ